MRTSKTMATIAVAAALGLAGCGGSSGSSGGSLSSFKSGYKAQKAQFTQLGADLARAITAAPKQSNSQLSAEFTMLADRASAQASDLAKLNPPSKYKAELTMLESSFQSVAGDLRAVSTAATQNNGPAAKAAGQRLALDALKVKAADDKLTGQLGLPKS